MGPAEVEVGLANEGAEKRGRERAHFEEVIKRRTPGAEEEDDQRQDDARGAQAVS